MVDKNFAYFIVDVYDADNIIVTWNIGAIAQWTISTEKLEELKNIVIKKERFKIEERS